MLGRQHSEALRRWRETWGERASQAPESSRISVEANHGAKFWDSYFTHLSKISWPDFVEAFEHFYFLVRCPTDIVAQLRLQVDPSSSQQVSRAAWQACQGSGRSIWDIMDALLGEVLQDVAPRIYRLEPLRIAGPRQGLATKEAWAAGSAGESEVMDAVRHLSLGSGAAAAGSALVEKKRMPWIPFAPGDDDDDMAIPTPIDQRLQQGADHGAGAAGSQPTMMWNDFVAGLCARHRPWWGSMRDADGEGASAAAFANEEARVAALRSVSSSLACTHKALIFRVVSGDLAQNRPRLDLRERKPDAPEVGEPENKSSLLPALVVTANGTRFSGVTKFGRSSSRRTLLPDCPMTEFIASRSHFNVVYEQASDKYYLMDAGSKWGTFVKIGSSVTLSCGDWIRVGGVEFIIRYCGGGCACRNRHTHYRLHSLQLLREHRLACGPWTARRRSNTCGSLGTVGTGDWGNLSSAALCDLEEDLDDDRGDNGSDEDEDSQLQDQLMLLLSSRRVKGWTTASARLCQKGARLRGGGSPRREPSPPPRLEDGDPATSSTPKRESRTPSAVEGKAERGMKQATLSPIPPLELDFISGPRMGEKVVLTERVCTLGRGEGNTIQVSDSQLASVSRVHSIFEFTGNRWQMRDNSSTNGTWRRLSCVLEPSACVPLTNGMSIQAGVHEFFVEEAEMRNWWIPSSAFTIFEDLVKQERREQQAQKTGAAQADTVSNVSSGR